ncbi:hypothetical protein AVEN_13346-1 [Araneus ventricosus]|uniref:Uncharacterized protein n=1 Tax=Araneus ventricosus TaxID=182803 RepID=A0A4Y2II09_ARAVE|nr:hypothetical protein AVEN_13346-1 [Araneus ventricosus]
MRCQHAHGHNNHYLLMQHTVSSLLFQNGDDDVAGENARASCWLYYRALLRHPLPLRFALPPSRRSAWQTATLGSYETAAGVSFWLPYSLYGSSRDAHGA